MNLIQKIFQAGVVGAGGAGFPTHIKLNSKAEYLIINGAECEPLLETDKYLMRTKSFEIIKAMEKVGKQVKAKKLVLGLKGKYEEEITQLRTAIEQLNSKVELFLLDNFYPAGDEQILVYEVTNRAISAGGIPLDVGVAVSNVGTLVNVFYAMADKPVVDKYVTVIGEVKNPCILKAPIGISVENCIEGAGGAVIDDYCVIMGGPMMGKIRYKDQVMDEVITKTVGSIILLPADHHIIKMKETPLNHIINRARTSCVQCSMCTEMCPRYLIGHKLRPHRIMRSVGVSGTNEEILKEALICCECGVCEMVACPMGLSPRMMNMYLKDSFRKKNMKYEKEKKETLPMEMRDYRKIPVKRLIARLGLTKYLEVTMEEPLEIKASRVSIPLVQHIGKPAVAVASVGDHVSRGQLIGQVAMEDMGTNVHASMDGIIQEVTDRIVISGENNGVIV